MSNPVESSFFLSYYLHTNEKQLKEKKHHKTKKSKLKSDEKYEKKFSEHGEFALFVVTSSLFVFQSQRH